MLLVIQHQTSLGLKMVMQWFCTKERRIQFITYKERLLEVTHVQPGMELMIKQMLQLLSLCTVSYGDISLPVTAQ